MDPSVALVRYGRLRQLAEFVPEGDIVLEPRAACVVKTPRGVELGTILAVLEPGSRSAVSPLVRVASGETSSMTSAVGCAVNTASYESITGL